MKLIEFISQRKEELISSRLYKDVQFKSAINVGLTHNGTTENFLTTESDTRNTGAEVVDFSALAYTGSDDNGSKVTFEVIPIGKRKYITKRFYFLFD